MVIVVTVVIVLVLVLLVVVVVVVYQCITSIVFCWQWPLPREGTQVRAQRGCGFPGEILFLPGTVQGGPLPSYKWSHNPYKWPYKWLTGVITPICVVSLHGVFFAPSNWLWLWRLCGFGRMVFTRCTLQFLFWGVGALTVWNLPLP